MVILNLKKEPDWYPNRSSGHCLPDATRVYKSFVSSRSFLQKWTEAIRRAVPECLHFSKQPHQWRPKVLRVAVMIITNQCF